MALAALWSHLRKHFYLQLRFDINGVVRVKCLSLSEGSLACQPLFTASYTQSSRTGRLAYTSRDWT